MHWRHHILLALALLAGDHITSTYAAGAFTDSCGNVAGVMTVDGDDGTITSPTWSSCVCYKTVESALSHDPSLYDFFDEVNDEEGDPQQAYDEVTGWLDSSSSLTSCSFPANSLSRCSSGNLCAYTCTQQGYVPGTNRDCVCGAQGYALCNGVCSNQACSTTGLKKKKKRDLSSLTRCPAGLTACGTVEGQSPFSSAWECVDTKYDDDNCGGCRIPFSQYLFRARDQTTPVGKDCSRITGSKKTMCNEGTCLVLKCNPGYKVSPSGRTCIKLSSGPKHHAPDAPPEAAFFGPYRR